MNEAINFNPKKLIKTLKSNRFDPVEYVEKAEDAAKLVLEMIPSEAKVGIGGSTSLMQLGVITELAKRGNITRSRPDIYLTGSNVPPRFIDAWSVNALNLI